MKRVGCCSAQLILLLMLTILVAVPLACIATATAPLHTPQMAEKFVCPPDTHIESEWYQASWNHPGEKTLSVTCVDEQGNASPTLPQDTKFWLSGMQTYLPYSLIPLFGIGVVALAALNLAGKMIGTFLKNPRGENKAQYKSPHSSAQEQTML